MGLRVGLAKRRLMGSQRQDPQLVFPATRGSEAFSIAVVKKSQSHHPDEVAMKSQLELTLRRGTKEHYADAEQYDHEYQRRKDDITFYLRIAEEFAKAKPILELGCGSGRLTVPLLRAGHRVVGIDAAPAMVERLRTRLQNLPRDVASRAELHVADFRELATAGSVLGRARYELVVCPFNAFQHLYERQDVERFLDGVRAHLRPRGLFVFDLMSPDLGWLSRDSTKRWSRTRYKDPRTGLPMIYSTQIVYDAPLQIAFMTIFYERADGKKRGSRRTLLTHRHFYPRELEALLHYNGFEIIRRDGDFAGRSLQPESEQQVLWCRASGSRPRRQLGH